VAADSYEPDNQLSSAASLVLGAAQQHTLTFGDTDNVTFPADSGSSYLLQITSAAAFNVYCQIYSGTPSVGDGVFVSQGTMFNYPWNCTRSGPCILQFQTNSMGNVGSYSIRVTKQ
jgi:hypothetical protein